MNINNISNISNTSPVFKSGAIQILAKANPNKPYLFNEVSDIVKKNHVMAIFHKKGIDINNPSKIVVEKLKESGIKFNKMA